MKPQARTEPTKPVYGIVNSRSTRPGRVASDSLWTTCIKPASRRPAEGNRIRPNEQDADDDRGSHSTVSGDIISALHPGWE